MGWTSKIHEVSRPGRATYYRCRIGRPIHLGTDRKRAERLHRALLAKHTNGAGTPLTVAELVDRWELERPDDWRMLDLRHWERFAGRKLLDEVSTDHLAAFSRWMARQRYQSKLKGADDTKHTYSTRTIRGVVQAAGQVLAWAVEKDWIKKVPSKPRLSKPVRNPRDVPPDVLKVEMSDLPERAERIISFIYATGCRGKEARLLTWNCIDLKRGMVKLQPAMHKTGGRTGRGRTIYLTEAAIEVLNRTPVIPDQPLVFPSREGRAYTPSGLRSILRRRGTARVRSLRHSFAQSALEQGTAIADVAKLLGHADLSTVQIYCQVRDPQALKAARKIKRTG